jgi:hypothetical protein
VGLLNKPSMAFFLVAMASVCCARRNAAQLLFTRWAAAGHCAAGRHRAAQPAVADSQPLAHAGVPAQRPGPAQEHVILNPLQFFLAQLLTMQPVNALLWITGVVALLRAKSIREGRWLGLTYVFFFAIMEALHAKDYYLAGIYPALFAAGGIAWERRFALSRRVQRKRIVAFPIFEGRLLVTSLLILPMSSPVLRPGRGCAIPRRCICAETRRRPPTPARCRSSTPTASAGSRRYRHRRRSLSITLTPGPAARLHLRRQLRRGRRNRLPGNRAMQPRLAPAISGQNSYWMWGTHGCDPECRHRRHQETAPRRTPRSTGTPSHSSAHSDQPLRHALRA